MFQTISPQAGLWESILPDIALRMPTEPESVDRLLDDPAFFEPYRAHFEPIWGRPSTPIETYLRMMFLKHPVPPRLRDALPGDLRLHRLDALLPHPLRGPGAGIPLRS